MPDFDIDAVLPTAGEADFTQLLRVLHGEEPDRPTLFEFFLNPRVLEKLSGMEYTADMSWLEQQKVRLKAFQRAGYDYLTVKVPEFEFTLGEQDHAASISQNEGAVISDRKSMQTYPWQNPDNARYDLVEEFAKFVPDNMKLIIWGPGGVLENAISLVGYENLCLLIMDDPELADDLFANIGGRLERYYQNATQFDVVGACISNDDWGFKTQTLFSPRAMRKYIFPWHKKIVAQIHAAGKPAILHSCGNFSRVVDDIVEDMQFDARHSYEDAIWPVEEAYEALRGRIAVLGGVDVDFVCRAEPQAVYQRAKAMLSQVKGRGGYALGTGNSVPNYVPDEGYFAILRAALEQR